MRVLLIYRVNISDEANAGVSKKMQGQMYGMLQNGCEVDVMYLGSDGIFCNEVKVAFFSNDGLSEVMMKYKGFYREVSRLKKKYDLALIRFTTLTPSFVRMLKTLRTQNPSIKIVLDLPTYPYAQEWSGVKGTLVLALDKLLRKNLPGLVDFIINYGTEKEVFGVPCIPMSNGILPVAFESKRPSENGELRIFAVGKWQYWHGLDRLIRGLACYEDKVRLDVVGEGLAVRSYKKLVNQLGLEESVNFHGAKTGKELKEFYKKADLGVGTLGLHRKGVKRDSSLKNRSYCINGLPFILGSEDLNFPEQCGFVKYFSGEGDVRMGDVANFYRSVRISNIEIHKYGVEKLGWGMRMGQIIRIISR